MLAGGLAGGLALLADGLCLGRWGRRGLVSGSFGRRAARRELGLDWGPDFFDAFFFVTLLIRGVVVALVALVFIAFIRVHITLLIDVIFHLLERLLFDLVVVALLVCINTRTL